jgi:redox-sensitive bicupin YhaK (pirin superfamily)
VADLSKGTRVPYTLEKDRAAWVHAVNGQVEVNGVTLNTGDAAAVTGENLVLTGTGSGSNEVLLFDVK